MKQSGQAILELMLFLTVIAWLMGTGLTLISANLSQRQERLDQQRLSLWQVKAIASGSENYSYARTIKPLLGIFNQLPDLQLPLANQHSVVSEQNLWPLTKLENSWSATTVSALVTEPRKLTVVPVLEKLGIDSLFRVLGRLPMSRELAQGEFEFGPINPDATPYEVMCQKQEQDCER